MNRKEEIKKALREWFDGQSKWKSKIEFASAIGIPYSTVKKYFNLGRYPKEKRNLEKMYQATRLSCFEPQIQKVKEVTPEEVKTEIRLVSTFKEVVEKSLKSLLDKVNNNILQHNKIKKLLVRLTRSWLNDSLDNVNRMLPETNRNELIQLYPEAEIIFEKIKMYLEQRDDRRFDEFEMKFKNYCKEKGIKLFEGNHRFIVDNIIKIEFNSKKNTVKVGILLLKDLTFEKIIQCVEEERKRVWGRAFNFSEFHSSLLQSYENLVNLDLNPTGWVRLVDVYQLLKVEIAKQRPHWKSEKRLVPYYKDEFSADLSKLWKYQINNEWRNQQIEFSSIRDPRLAFRVILPDGSIASYGFIRPKRD